MRAEDHSEATGILNRAAHRLLVTDMTTTGNIRRIDERPESILDSLLCGAPRFSEVTADLDLQISA